MKYIVVFLSLLSIACAQDNSKTAPKTEAQPIQNTAQAEEHLIQWMTINEALALQKTAPKKIFIDFYTSWCGPCKLLDKKTFHNQDVANYINENYYAVKFDAEGNEKVSYDGKEFGNPNYKETTGRGYPHEFSMFMKVNAYPTMVFLDEAGQYITPVKGLLQPQELEPFLKVMATDEYKAIQTQEQWQAWMEDFKPEFE